MKVLIIGGTGIISTGIVKALKERGATITVFNRGRTDDRLGADVRRIVGDRSDFGSFERTIAAEGPWDVVIDMICFAPEEAQSTLRAIRGRCGHFIFCSTVCTYGNTQTTVPTDETTPQNPLSSYGRGKLACEAIFLSAHADGIVPATILRPSHTYGPGGGVINNLNTDLSFVSRLRASRPILVSGDGHGLWQSTYCDDVGRGFAYCAGNARCFGEAFNAVGDELVTWDEYTLRTAAGIGAPEPRLVHVPTDLLLAIAPQRYISLAEIFRYHGAYSNRKLKAAVPEFRMTVRYEDGIRRTIEWLDQHGRIPAFAPAIEDRIIEAWDRLQKDLLFLRSP